MSRPRRLAVGLAVGSVLAVGVLGCAKSVDGTPLAASTPAPSTTTGAAPAGNVPTSSSSDAASSFCQSIETSWVSQSFGVTGVTIAPGPPEDTGDVQTVLCNVTAARGFTATILGQLYPSSSYTSQSVIALAQQELNTNEGATNMQTLSGIGDADLAFYCQTKNKIGGTNDVVFAVKAISAGIAASEFVVAQAVGQDKLIAFAKLADTD